MTDKIEKMTDDDFKKIMQSLGMPDSMSLYAALKQVENHTWQAAQSVPVVGEPVGFILIHENGLKNLTFHDNTGELSDDWSQHKLVIQPTTSIPAAELERLREKQASAERERDDAHEIIDQYKGMAARYKACMDELRKIHAMLAAAPEPKK